MDSSSSIIEFLMIVGKLKVIITTTQADILNELLLWKGDVSRLKKNHDL